MVLESTQPENTNFNDMLNTVIYDINNEIFTDSNTARTFLLNKGVLRLQIEVIVVEML
jgi:hypothetical protein